MKLAIEIWNQHIEVFEHFDLVCHNGHSLEDETKSNALFNAIITLEWMVKSESKLDIVEKYNQAIDYLMGSKYYSHDNKDSDY